MVRPPRWTISNLPLAMTRVSSGDSNRLRMTSTSTSPSSAEQKEVSPPSQPRSRRRQAIVAEAGVGSAGPGKVSRGGLVRFTRSLLRLVLLLGRAVYRLAVLDELDALVLLPRHGQDERRGEPGRA